MAEQQEGKWVVPNPQIPRTFGMMNIVFGILLFLVGAGYIAVMHRVAYVSEADGGSNEGTAGQREGRARREDRRLKTKEEAAKTKEEKETLSRTSGKTLENERRARPLGDERHHGLECL